MLEARNQFLLMSLDHHEKIFELVFGFSQYDVVVAVVCAVWAGAKMPSQFVTKPKGMMMSRSKIVNMAVF